MTSKNSFWKFSIWNFKKRAWTFALCAVIWFFALTVPMFMETQHITQIYSNSLIDDMEWIQRMLINSFISGSGLHAFLAIIMAMFLGIQSFSWNNHQQKVDMYKAVPVKASSRFWYINLNSLCIFVITYGSSLILVNIIAAVHGVWATNFLYATALSFIMHLMLFAGIYCVVLIAQYLTGNIILGVMGSAILIFIEPACYLLKEGLKSLFYDTYAGSDSYVVAEDGIFSPFAPFLKAYKTVSMTDAGFADTVGYSDVWLPLLLLLVHIIIYGSIAYALYQRRPAQTGGKTMIFPKTKPVIKCVLMVVGSLYFGGIMSSFGGHETLGYGIFGIICGLVIFHVVLQSIMNGGFKEALKGKIGFGVAAILAFAIYLGYAFDVTGFDTYLPDADEVESFAFIRQGDYVYDIYNERGEYVSTREYFTDHMSITDEASKEALLAMLQTAIENNDYCEWDSDENDYSVAPTGEIAKEVSLYSTYEDGDTQENVTVLFRLNNGKTVERSYVLRINDIRNFWAGIYELPQYKELAYMILRDEVKEAMEREDSYSHMTYHVYGTNLSDFNSRSEELLQQCYEALYADISARNAETVLNDAPIGEITLTMETEQRETIYHLAMPIYENDVNTVKLLKENGWYVESGINAEDALSVTVTQTIDDGYDHKILEVSTDASYYEEVIDCLILSDAFNYVIDAGSVTKEDYYAEVNVLVDGLTYTYSCSLDKDKFPEELEEAFEDVIPESQKEDDSQIIY